MTSSPPFTPETATPAPPSTVELSVLELEGLRKASGWSRFAAILGFILSGLAAIGVVVAIAMRARSAESVLLMVASAVFVGPWFLAALFVWKYGSRLRSFILRGEPDAAEGFRSLRHFFVVWTIVSAVAVLFSLFSTLQHLLQR